MIRHMDGKRNSTQPIMVFRDHQLAHKWCKGRGLELGAAAHNPFNLVGALNVAPYSDDPFHPDHKEFLFFKSAQVQMCGQYAEIDIRGEAASIPVEDNSKDYIISSHVIEHVPNPIAAFVEWNRVVRAGGVVFMIAPLRDAHAPDASRPITPLDDLVEAYQENYTALSHPDRDVWRGHFYVYTLVSMLELIQWCNDNLGLSWQVVATEERDSKVGNGFTVVIIAG